MKERSESLSDANTSAFEWISGGGGAGAPSRESTGQHGRPL